MKSGTTTTTVVLLSDHEYHFIAKENKDETLSLTHLETASNHFALVRLPTYSTVLNEIW